MLISTPSQYTRWHVTNKKQQHIWSNFSHFPDFPDHFQIPLLARHVATLDSKVILVLVSHAGIETSTRSLADCCITLHWAQSGRLIVVSGFRRLAIRNCSTVCSRWLVWWRVKSPVQSLVRWRIRWWRLFVCKKVKASHVFCNTRTVILTNASLLFADT